MEICGHCGGHDRHDAGCRPEEPLLQIEVAKTPPATFPTSQPVAPDDREWDRGLLAALVVALTTVMVITAILIFT